MPEKPWQKQFQKLLTRAGDEFKRTSDELKVEAQRLLGEVRDPANQRKVKEGLRDIGAWAKKAADQAAEAMEAAVKKAEVTWKGSDGEEKTPVSAVPASKATSPKSPPKPAAPKPAAAKKTVGKKAVPTAKASKPAGKASAKSIGKKKPKPS